MSDLRVTVVHERFTDFAGSEKVVSELAREWPDAPVLAPLLRPEILDEVLTGRVRGTALSRLLRGDTYAHLLPLLPLAMRRLPVGDADIVVASHHAFANQVVHATAAPVVSYVHSPARWVWEPSMRAGEMGGRVGGALLTAFAAAYRGADREAAARVRSIVANSTAVAERVRLWWGRDADVVPPPVDVEFYRPDPDVAREDFVLVAGRLVPYKRPELAIRAAVQAGVPVVVAGSGRAEAECRRVAGPNVTFLGRVDDEALRDLYRRCRLLLMPGVEDFGIVPVEAQACGAPVLAQAAGGALDVVDDGRTGRLLPTPADDDDAVGVWAEALRSAPTHYDAAEIRRHAEGFSRSAFRERIRAIVAAAASG
jgi:glycosyltransferase involved in cell wall biosynthesis